MYSSVLDALKSNSLSLFFIFSSSFFNAYMLIGVSETVVTSTILIHLPQVYWVRNQDLFFVSVLYLDFIAFSSFCLYNSDFSIKSRMIHSCLDCRVNSQRNFISTIKSLKISFKAYLSMSSGCFPELVASLSPQSSDSHYHFICYSSAI